MAAATGAAARTVAAPPTASPPASPAAMNNFWGGIRTVKNTVRSNFKVLTCPLYEFQKNVDFTVYNDVLRHHPTSIPTSILVHQPMPYPPSSSITWPVVKPAASLHK